MKKWPDNFVIESTRFDHSQKDRKGIRLRILGNLTVAETKFDANAQFKASTSICNASEPN